MRQRSWVRPGLGVGAIAGIAGVTVAAASVALAIAGPFARGLSSAWSITPPEPAAPAGSTAADDGAAVVGERMRSERMLDLTIRSPVLDALGRVRLLLPPDWSPSATRTWPVLWLLHGPGPGAGYAEWTANTSVERLTEGIDVIVVMPDGGRAGIYTDWWNLGSSGPPMWETFHLAELRQILERGYRAGTARAIAGISTGGTGALAYAARHRGLFRAAASLSGPLDTLYGDTGGLDPADLVQLAIEICCPGTDWRRVWGEPDAQRVVWRQHNPYDLADRLAGTRLYLSAGDRGATEELARMLTARFAAKLKKLGIPASVHLYQGEHSWVCWERELHAALPILLAEIL